MWRKLFTFDRLKCACLMTTNALDAVKMLLGFDRFFCFANFILQKSQSRINFFFSFFKNRNKYSRIGFEKFILEYLIILKCPSLLWSKVDRISTLWSWVDWISTLWSWVDWLSTLWSSVNCISSKHTVKKYFLILKKFVMFKWFCFWFI